MPATEQDDILLTYFQRLPKVELHLHLEGAIPLPSLWRLIEKEGGGRREHERPPRPPPPQPRTPPPRWSRRHSWHHICSFVGPCGIEKDDFLRQLRQYIPGHDYVMVGNVLGLSGASGDRGA